MASDGVIELTDDNFEAEALKADTPVLVDFWAEWCGPCRMLTPIIHEIAEATAGRLKVGKVNVDQAQRVATQYGIQSIPTLILLVGGQVKETLIGAQPKAQILAKIEAYLGAS